MRRLLLALALIGPAMWSGPLLAQDYEKGVEAFHRGDYATALQEFLFFVEQGGSSLQVMGAQFRLGYIYQEGFGVPQDYAEAIRLYRLSAEQGYAPAQSQLGTMYEHGYGMPEDSAEAAKLYRLAAEQGFRVAQRNLGVMYYYGRGIIQDYILSHMWLNISASLGYEDAADARDIVSIKMTPDQIAEAQRLARECVARSYKGC